MQRTQIYLPKQQLKELQIVSRKNETTVSAVIRMFLTEKLRHAENRGSKRIGIPLLTAAKKINAQGKAGPKDLASRLDHYLYES